MKHIFRRNQSHRCLCQVSHLLVASIGIGSACFHCTLRHVEQQCDETPMVLSQLNWFHELFADVWENNSLASAVMPVFLAIYGVVGAWNIRKCGFLELLGFFTVLTVATRQ